MPLSSDGIQLRPGESFRRSGGGDGPRIEGRAYVDENQRTTAAALTSLTSNGRPLVKDDNMFFQAMIDVAGHRLDKPGRAAILRRPARR